MIFTIANTQFPLKSPLGHPWDPRAPASSQIPLREYPDCFQIASVDTLLPRLLCQGYIAQVTQPRLRCQVYAAKGTLPSLHSQGYTAKVTLPRLRSQGYVAQVTQPRLRSQGYTAEVTYSRIPSLPLFGVARWSHMEDSLSLLTFRGPGDDLFARAVHIGNYRPKFRNFAIF